MNIDDYELDDDGYIVLKFVIDEEDFIKNTINKNPLNKNGVPDGLFYFLNMIPEDLSELLTDYYFSDDSSAEWFPVGSSKNSREVIQYGFMYNYVSGGVKEPAKKFPPLMRRLVDIISTVISSINGPKDLPFNQCIVNKYLSGQGISAHIDNPQYADFICCFTIGGGIEIEFTKDKMRFPIYVQPNSLYIMSGESRYKWKHSISNRKSDVIEKEGERVVRQPRISFTFRSVV